MTAPLPVLGEKHVEAFALARVLLARRIHPAELPPLHEIGVVVRALVAGEVVMVKPGEIEHLRICLDPHVSPSDLDDAREIVARWLTPQTQEKK